MQVKHEVLAEQLLTFLEVIAEVGGWLVLTQAKAAGRHRNIAKSCLKCPLTVSG